MMFSSISFHALLILLLLEVIVGDWIDPDTPLHAQQTKSLNPFSGEGTTETRTEANNDDDADSDFDLVFSDEFNVPGRRFEDGADPRWTALEKNDYTNDALHYYSEDNAVTSDDGDMVITSEAKDTKVNGFNDVKGEKERVTKHFKSAMVQSWNKFCFTGGIVEAEVVLPGYFEIGGLWPAFWLLGNLVRHTYVGSSDHVWPWSSNVCNNHTTDAQLINACSSNQHYGLQPGVGRGAPEMDIFEVQPGNVKAGEGMYLKTSVGQPCATSSFQVSPGRASRPGNGWWPGPGQWYDGIKGGKNTSLNILFYGTYNHFLNDANPAKQDYWSDSISYLKQLTEDHFTHRHKYRLEWDLPTQKKDGYLRWYFDDELVLNIDGYGLKQSNAGASISTEPSYIILNTAISKQWGFPTECPPGCPCKEYDCNSPDWQKRCGFSRGFCEMMKEAPPKYKVNWVRVYQNPKDTTQKVGCSTPERPTRKFIQGKEKSYKQEHDLTSLKSINRGRGACDPTKSRQEVHRSTCGGSERGRCTNKKICECNTGWTGPHCLAHSGSDPILYDLPDQFTDIGFALPNIVSAKSYLVLILLLLLFLFVAASLRKNVEQWKPIRIE